MNQFRKRLDGWKNVLTGLGITGKDKRMSSIPHYQRFTELDAEQLYGSDDIAAKIVDAVVDDMFRMGFEVKSDDKRFPTLNMDVQNWLEEREILPAFKEATQWGRMYGGAGLILGIEDGVDPSMPINLNSINDIKFTSVVNRYELHRQQLQSDPLQKNFGLPLTYQLQPHSGSINLEVLHWTRLIRFDGVRLPRRLFIQNDYWHDSVLNRVLNVIRNYQSSYDSAATLLQDFSQAVFKLKNLSEMIALGKDDLVQKRLALVDRTRSTVNAIVIQDDEEFDRKVTSLTGLPETLRLMNSRLVAATSIPHTILLGESPSGLGASGESEKNDWYDHVRSKQESDLKPRLNYFFKLMFLSKNGPTKGNEPENWRIEFKPLKQLTQKEIIDSRKVQADIDTAYINTGVLSPEEVAVSRFGTDEYSYETKVLSEPEIEQEDDLEEESEDLKEEEVQNLISEIETFDGGPGSGRKPEGGSFKTKEAENLSKAIQREKAAESMVMKFNKLGDYTSAESIAARKEYKSSKTNRQKAVREAKKQVSILKSRLS